MSRYGYLFVLPIIIGLALIFIPVVIQSLYFSTGDIKMSATGYQLISTGVKNYKDALLVDPDFRRHIVSSLQQFVVSVPVVVIFSFFLAVILNQKFVGRAFARAVFFLPVIIATGIIATVESGDTLTQMYASGDKFNLGMTAATAGGYTYFKDMLLQANVSSSIADVIVQSIEQVYSIIISSGVQMLIFLAALQSISPALYEAAKVEGATGWECFWKISLPMVSPIIMVNVVYTIITKFYDESNVAIAFIGSYLSRPDKYGFASAMSWIYFAVVAVVLVIVWLIVNKLIVYQD